MAAAADPTAAGATRTVTWQVGARTISVLAGIAATALVARSFSTDEFADWQLVFTIMGMVAFAVDPGISPVLVRRILHSPEDAPSPRGMIPVRLGLGVLSLAVIVGVSVGVNGAGTALLAVALGGSVVPRALALNATPWLQVDQRLHRQTALEAVSATLGLALLGAGVAADLPTWALGLGGFTIPTLILAALMQREVRITPARLREVPGEQAERVRSVLLEIAPLAGAIALVAIYTRIFAAFLPFAEPKAEVARFLLAFLFVDQLVVVAAIVAGAMLPLFAVRARTEKLPTDPVTHRLITAVAGAGALIGAALVGLAPQLTGLIGGSGLDGADRYLELLAPNAPLLFTSFAVAYVYVTIGRSKRYLLYNAIGLLACLAGQFALTLTYGAGAAARVSWGTELLVTGLAITAVVSGRSGRSAIVRVALAVAAVVLGGELAAAGTLAAPVAGLVIVAVTLLATGRQLLWTGETVGLRLRSPIRLRA